MLAGISCKLAQKKKITFHLQCVYIYVAKVSTTCTGISSFSICCFFFVIYIYIRAVSVNALIYAINLAAINALKYFYAINATLFTSGVR